MTNETCLVILDNVFKNQEEYKDKPLYQELAKVYREALEKKIPKKPKDKYVNVFMFIDWVCPTCGSFHRNDFALKYCSDCGQAIDWSDVE